MARTVVQPTRSSMDVMEPLVLNHRSVMNRTRDEHNLSQNDCVQLELLANNRQNCINTLLRTVNRQPGFPRGGRVEPVDTPTTSHTCSVDGI